MVWYQWSLTGGQSPNVALPGAGKLVIHTTFQRSASDRAGLNGALGEMKLEPSFDVQVSFQGNQIIVVQYLKVYCFIKFRASKSGGNVVDIKLTNTFTIAVNADGQLTSTMTSTREDHSELPGQNGFLNFFADLNKLVSTVKEWAARLADASFKDLPLSAIQAFVFPGGNTFVFKDVNFSDYQDLVAHVIYADPTKNLHLTKLGRRDTRGATPNRAPLPDDVQRPILTQPALTGASR